MTNSAKIFASYIPTFDNYVANVSEGTKDIIITEENGSELAETVKKETGIEIEYNYNSRTFLIPKENMF